ncbi:protein O-mannosyl-transferase 2 [Aplysia californica]|uniref:Protein O-mannosyl-transferase 2 n=1 Tax=Aplysia californica TaxID=6500 RepID=A0ABM0JDV8_APLCA|nr:protein O-mannosyl-transferase 2 [Aplysia californica]
MSEKSTAAESKVGDQGDFPFTGDEPVVSDDSSPAAVVAASSTSGGSITLSGGKPGKAASDTAVHSRPPSHGKALSSHRLDCLGATQRDHCSGEPDLGTYSSENSEMDPKKLMKTKTLKLSKNSPEKVFKGTAKEDSPTKLRRRKGDSKDVKVESVKGSHTAVEEDSDVELTEAEQNWRETKAYYLSLAVLSLVSLITRIYNIETPAHVCWDETHFGKMGSWYINRTFFFDVHPPLGKMLIGLAGVVSGYDGSFPFSKPGDEYGDTNYVGMRVFCALLGTLLVPLSYQVVWLLTHSILAGIFAAALVIFDTGVLTLSRHILLDPILMFFILLSVFSCLKFLSFRSRPFSPLWWFWMAATGSSLAGALGVKFVGLFVILFIGYTTASDLWNLLSDLSVSLFLLCKHIFARVACLIVVPFLVYCFFFCIHFKVLNRSGNGDGFFSSGFQSQLQGNRLYNISMPQYIAFGSILTLKQRRTGGAYLHSHVHLYPEEHPPKQQQVTSYSHKDENNKWLIKSANQETNNPDEVTYVKSGDIIRLEHVITKRNLHSHKEPAPMSKHQYQVSGYGMNGTGDMNDYWLIEIDGHDTGERVQTVRSKLRLIHYHVRCALHSHDKKLPKWGWEQLEVSCHPNIREPSAVWSVEEVIDPRLPNVSFEVYSPSFVEMFMESHAVMTQGNSGLKPKEGEITSRPWQWPIDFRGQVFSGQNHRIYMLGNPVIFWLLLGLKAVFLLIWAAFNVGCKRKIPMQKDLKTYCERTFKVCWWLLLAWFLHYAPFWGMARVLYFHHYFPAFLFSAMFGGVMLDFIITLLCVCVPEGIAMKVFHWCILFVISAIIFSFYLFYPLAYGMSGPMAADEAAMMHRVKWLESWDI